MSNKYIKISIIILALVLVVVGILFAGDILTQTEAPSPTGYTLEDIYNKLTDSGYTSSPSHDLKTSNSTSTPSMYSLEDIFTIVPEYKTLSDSTTTLSAGIYSTTTLSDIELNLLPDNIASGTTIFGVTGILECAP